MWNQSENILYQSLKKYEEMPSICRQIERERELGIKQLCSPGTLSDNGFDLLTQRTQTWQKKKTDAIIQTNDILIWGEFFFYQMEGLIENCNSTLARIGLIERHMK